MKEAVLNLKRTSIMRSMVDDFFEGAAVVAEQRSCASKLDQMRKAVQKLKGPSTSSCPFGNGA